ncbi:predicted protein [Phaeodactylum tricornutum CCAP 1055/1]|uniref:Cytochrome P450 n=1 Tax=Phaeodactylum tricornutum (strain CCAP 1055/1) TaxID=556484 RepID=B7FUI7_PHATC|nr:predicted protein [Phaeodactylum tricornutum CCAP 1055/1]EEC49993.1 predicted protein [Phaeodactylum tricornutum CCAP 1055/1]|eukprot:XP_002178328.1 predicted protein [Phaeodactylum tricornutum CCAP 1055/1]
MTYESYLIKTWEQDPSQQQGLSFIDFLVSKSGSDPGKASRPVGLVDVVKLRRDGTDTRMAAIPNAVIQKHKVPFFSFIKGVLGGDLQTLAGCPFFLLLNKYLQVYGPVFNLSFGPKSFLVVSDPVMARHVLLETSPEKYCKGMLAEILDPIMGKGLIPANPAIWKVRHRAIVPSFHKQWLNRMIAIFAKAPKFSPMIYNANQPRGSVTLDIIGKAAFNYDFGSVTDELPIVKAVYRVLKEAKRNQTTPRFSAMLEYTVQTCFVGGGR